MISDLAVEDTTERTDRCLREDSQPEFIMASVTQRKPQHSLTTSEEPSRLAGCRGRHARHHIPRLTKFSMILTMAACLLSAPTAVASRDSSLTLPCLYLTSPATTTTTTTLATTITTFLVTTTLWHARPARSLPPQDAVIQEIMMSNLTSEGKFQRVLKFQHRRFCETSRTCLNYDFGNCGYCRPCQCDDLCVGYGDCCPDKLMEHIDVVQPISISLACRDNLYVEYTEEQRQSRLKNATSYLMTASCPSATSAGLAQSCADRSNYLPVSVPAEGGTGVQVYTNKFCALCNGVDGSETVPWKTLLHCQTDKNITSSSAKDIAREAIQDNDCFLVYFPPPTLPSPRRCYYDDTMITTCNVTGDWPKPDPFTERACSAYLDPKMAEGRLFQNVFCYICNSAEPELFSVCERSPILSPMPFSALLDFGDAIYRGKSAWEHPEKCSPSELYDDTINQCRPVLCAPGRQFMDGQCTAVFGTARYLTYSLYFSAILGDDVDLYDGHDLLHSLPGALEYYILLDKLGQVVRITNFQVSFEITDEDGRCSQKSRVFSVFSTFKVMADVDQDTFEQQLMNVRNTTMRIRLSPNFFLNFTSKVDEQVWLTQKHRASQNAGRSCSTTVSNFHVSLDGDAEALNTRVTKLLTLPKVALTHDEFHMQTSDLSVKVPWLDEAIPLDRYESTAEGKIYIAVEDFMPKLTAYRKSLSKPDQAEVIVSIVCTSLSLAGLTLTLFTYSIFKPLRTAPGQNNMNLCVTLFLAQLFYLVGSGRTEVPGVCQAMGILIHYFWLTAFAAMSVCSYHMWRVFTSLKPSEDIGERRRRFLHYTIYIWGAAAAVVGLTLLVHMIATEGDDIGYGGQQCYLSTAVGVGVAVGIPVALTLTASIAFFTLTVRTIRHSPKVSKSRDDERHVWIYFKLSTLTGATWALAFVIFFTDVKELRYVFTLVNGLQGVFICLSFVCNRRVAKLYLACCKGGHPRLLSTNASTNSSTLRSYRNDTVSTISRHTETSFTDPSSTTTTAAAGTIKT